MQKEIKSASTNDVYQSTFMPLFEKAEKTIKKIIITYFLLKTSRFLLVSALNKYINELDKKIPKDIENRQDYIDGLKFKTGKWVIEYYNKPTEKFINYVHIIKKQALGINDQKIVSLIKKIETPKDLANFITNHGKEKVVLRMFEQTKGSVRILDYPKQIQEAMDRLAKQPLTTHEKGKKPISLWQKAELDIRHSNQMAMVEKCKDSGNDLWWISSHPDCSKRCEKWQGKLVSVNRHATMSGFRVEKVDGQWVYSLTEIMAQTDKYGYNNNIISGFNCRHHLIQYESGKKPPKEFSKEDIKKQRAVENKIREMEREIRNLKKLLAMKPDNAKQLRAKIKQKEAEYYAFCKSVGYASQKYRIDI